MERVHHFPRLFLFDLYFFKLRATFKVMKKRLFLSIFILFTLLFAGTSQAFIPGAPHLLYLVINKIKQPVGIEARQTRTILNYQESGPAYIELKEKLLFSYPNKLRIQILTQDLTSFSVESEFGFVKISDGILVSSDKSLIDLYSDILLYRDHETLLTQLDIWGIDTTKVSFQRYNDTICYVIGGPQEDNHVDNFDFPGLWIEKDTFLPIKYVVEKNGKRVEFFYKNWQKISKTMYPMQIHIFLDNRLFAMIDINNIHLRSGFLPVLFDIDNIVSSYPENFTIDDNYRHEESNREADLKPSLKYNRDTNNYR